MKKTCTLGLALSALMAFAAVSASTAFAESEFLIDEKPVSEFAGTENPTIRYGEQLVLLNTKTLVGTIAESCSFWIYGEILLTEANHVLITLVEGLTGKDYVKGSELVGSGESCMEVLGCPAPEVWPDNLPWLAEIVLMTAGSPWLLHLTEDSEEPAGQPGWDISCKNNGLSGLCTGLVSFLLEDKGIGTVSATITQAEMEAEKEAWTCSLGGEGYLETTTGFLEVPGHKLELS